MGLDWFRKAEWLDRGRVGGYLAILALVNCGALAWLIGTSAGGVDRSGHLLGTDFLSFWTVGKLLAQGGSAYDQAAHVALQREFFASPTGYTAFFYPPPFLLYCQPLGLLGYFSALGAWLALTGGAFALALRGWLAPLTPARFALALFAFPAVLLTITHGQTSFLIAALLGGGCWLLVSGRKVLAGILFGLAVIKPQFGLLLPILLLASREWRTIASAVVTALVLAGLTTLAYGADVWLDWQATTAKAQQALTEGAMGFARLQSLFAAARLAGLGATGALALQAILAAFCAILIARAGWRQGFTRETAAAMLAGSLLVTPFVLDYDLLLLAFPLTVLAMSEARSWERFVTLLGFALPAFARPLAMETGIVLAPAILLALFVLLLRRAHDPQTARALP
jgi:hypothetical protein